MIDKRIVNLRSAGPVAKEAFDELEGIIGKVDKQRKKKAGQIPDTQIYNTPGIGRACTDSVLCWAVTPG